MKGEAPVEFAALCLAPAFDEPVAPGGAPGANEHPGGKGLNVAPELTDTITMYVDGKLVSGTPPAGAPDEVESPVADVLYGDVDVNGVVDILDVVLINKSLLGGATLTAQGKTNADVDVDDAIDSTDALNILKAVVKLVTLPVGKK